MFFGVFFGGGGGGDIGNWISDGGVVIICEGDEPVFLPGTIGVTATNGTRSFVPIESTAVTVTASGASWPVNIVHNNISIVGSLVWCCNAPRKGLYFAGTVYSLNGDPDIGSASGWCGCARRPGV